MDMYWADTEEGFQAFYACLLAMAKAEYQRRFPQGDTTSVDRKAAEEKTGRCKKMTEIVILSWPFCLTGIILGLPTLIGAARW